MRSLLLSGILALVPVSDELNAISELKWVKWMSRPENSPGKRQRAALERHLLLIWPFKRLVFIVLTFHGP